MIGILPYCIVKEKWEWWKSLYERWNEYKRLDIFPLDDKVFQKTNMTFLIHSNASTDLYTIKYIKQNLKEN
jgi:hypothetical protein